MATKLATVSKINPENPAWMMAAVMQGSTIDPNELMLRSSMYATLRTLDG